MKKRESSKIRRNGLILHEWALTIMLGCDCPPRIFNLQAENRCARCNPSGRLPGIAPRTTTILARGMTPDGVRSAWSISSLSGITAAIRRIDHA
jgi:hypothetical protein